MTSEPAGPPTLFALDYLMIFERSAEGQYAHDSGSIPDEEWLVELSRAGLLGHSDTKFSELPDGAPIRLIEYGAIPESESHVRGVRPLEGGGGRGGGVGGGVASSAIYDAIKTGVKAIGDAIKNGGSSTGIREPVRPPKYNPPTNNGPYPI